MRNFMLEREKRYGTFFWRLDGWIEAPCMSTKHDHPAGQPFVKQYRHYMDMLREVKDANAEMGIQGCNSGGEWANWDKFELLENNQCSDGDGPDDFYYLSYFWPVAKMAGGGDTVMRNFLKKEGIYDRYMKVFHPRTDNAPTQHTYIEFTNGDRTKAIISQDAVSEKEVVIYPKALISDYEYSVTFRYAKDSYKAKGAELMASGIRIKTDKRNEVILLNLDNAPGRGTDTIPPKAPTGISKKKETWNGRTGVAIRWSPSKDNGLIARYEITSDGKKIDDVALGTFYFDPGADNKKRYEIIAVDGDGNCSKPAIIK